MERRGFVRGMAGACAAGALSILPLESLAQARPKFYGRARLVDSFRRPLRAASLVAQRNYIFLYPFAATPCFLLNMGKPVPGAATLQTTDAQPYQWPGGVGRGKGIVAYSAICSHKLSYPTRQLSFISFQGAGEKSTTGKDGGLIHCCSEHSRYDPAQGAKVLSGPAPQPLATILLEHDERADELFAVGTLGGEMFNDFFAKYEFRLGMEYGSKAKALVEGECMVSELTSYCRQQISC